MDDKLEDSLIQELRRGTASLAVLLATREPAYGYSLVADLQEEGVDVEQNTLYPLLRRLEKQGLLASSWNTDEARPRKYYSVTPAGKEMAARLVSEWRRIDRVMSHMIGKEEEE
jgi:DNA-binding PadR family transcriptional regulator